LVASNSKNIEAKETKSKFNFQKNFEESLIDALTTDSHFEQAGFNVLLKS